MSRIRLADTAIAALATAVVSWPLTTLFTPNSWIRPTMVMVALVAAAGLLGRRLTTSKTGVLLVQLVAVVVGAGWVYGRGHLWHGLPTVDMVLAFNNVLVDARETIQNYAAPAPTNRGIILAVGLAMALTAMLVDHLAVMRRSPALAGLPLLTAFLISASNSGSSLHPIYFIMAAAVWLVMVGRQGIEPGTVGEPVGRRLLEHRPWWREVDVVHRVGLHRPVGARHRGLRVESPGGAVEVAGHQRVRRRELGRLQP